MVAAAAAVAKQARKIHLSAVDADDDDDRTTLTLDGSKIYKISDVDGGTAVCTLRHRARGKAAAL